MLGQLSSFLPRGCANTLWAKIAYGTRTVNLSVPVRLIYGTLIGIDRKVG